MQPGSPPANIGEVFVEKTKYRYLSTPDQEKHLLQPLLEMPSPYEEPLRRIYECRKNPFPPRLGEALMQDRSYCSTI